MKNPSKRITWKEISRQKFLMVCAAIFFVYGIVFYYVPLAGWVMAFQDYKPKDGLFGSKFVGLAKFKFLFSDDVFLRDIRNTLAMGVLNLVTTFLMAIIFAILLNEVRNMFGKKACSNGFLSAPLPFLDRCHRYSARCAVFHRYHQ